MKQLKQNPTGTRFIQLSLWAGSRRENLVNPTQLPENNSEKTTLATSGRKCLELFQRSDRNGSWAKTFSELLVGVEGWSSTRCKLTWRLKDTTYKRMYFQLQASALPIEDIESGLWLIKTPTTMDGEVSSGKNNPVSGDSGMLAQEIMSGYAPTMKKLRLLPTPQARDEKSGSRLEDSRTQRKMAENWSFGLNDLAAMKMLPTPTGTDYKGARSEEALKRSGRKKNNNLPDAFSQPGKASQLNPLFVAEMMGFPTNWTLLPFLNGEKDR